MTEIASKEKWLLAQAREGNIESFSALVQLHQERAVHTAYSILGNFEDARDAAQEAFIKAHASLGSFRQDSLFFTWFYRILSNTCKDVLRKRKARGFVSFWKKEDPETGDILERDAASRERSALENIQDRELEETVFSAMNELPFQQRNAFALRYLEGLSMEEIAQNMHLSVGAVKAHLWQAMQKMRKSLKSIVQ